LISPPAGPDFFGITATPLPLLLSKNMLSHFFNPDFIGTGEKEAAYPVTGGNSEHNLKTQT
jgi:hypothetical protein